MGGRDAGFDMGAKEGVGAWLPAVQSKPLPASVCLPSLGAPSRPVDTAAATRAKENQRKAARKARKKKR
jgi:hypothetical protein